MRERAQETVGCEAIGQPRGKIEQKLGSAYEEEREIGSSVGREVEQEAQGIKCGGRIDQVGIINDQ